MNDNDIIKALEHCLVSGDCAACMYNEARCMDLTQEAFSLINRQRTEIETLKAMLDAAERYLHPLPFKDDFDKAVDKSRSEAIREFAERLCNGRVSNDPVVIAANCVLEEMTEE